MTAASARAPRVDACRGTDAVGVAAEGRGRRASAVSHITTLLALDRAVADLYSFRASSETLLTPYLALALARSLRDELVGVLRDLLVRRPAASIASPVGVLLGGAADA